MNEDHSGKSENNSPEPEATPNEPTSGSEEVRNADDIKYDVVAMLKTVYDPEIPVDIYELGLI